jgi:hypothetical protein
MWVVVWSEDQIAGPFATQAQARAYVTGDSDDPHLHAAADDFVRPVHRPNTPDYDGHLTLAALMIKGDR